MAVVKSPKNSKRRILWIKLKSFRILKSQNTVSSFAYKNLLKLRRNSLNKIRKSLTKYPKRKNLEDPYWVKFEFNYISLNFFSIVLPSNRKFSNSSYKKITLKRIEKRNYLFDVFSYFF